MKSNKILITGSSGFIGFHISKHLLESKFQIVKRRKGDVIIAFADVSKIKQNIGWVCKHSVEDALKSSWCWEKNLRDE